MWQLTGDKEISEGKVPLGVCEFFSGLLLGETADRLRLRLHDGDRLDCVCAELGFRCRLHDGDILR